MRETLKPQRNKRHLIWRPPALPPLEGTVGRLIWPTATLVSPGYHLRSIEITGPFVWRTAAPRFDGVTHIAFVLSRFRGIGVFALVSIWFASREMIYSPQNWVKGAGGNFAHETQSNGCPPSQSLLGPQEWQDDPNSKWDLN